MFVEVYVSGGARHISRPQLENTNPRRMPLGAYTKAVCGVAGPLFAARADADELFWRIYPKCGRCLRWMEGRGASWPTREAAR